MGASATLGKSFPMRPIYLDYNATTPIHPGVLAAMRPYLEEHFGNPSSGHVYGQTAKAAVERARGEAAALLNASPTEILFTSGGSESNNLALVGAARLLKSKGNHLIISAVEHPAVRQVAATLVKDGFALTVLPVDADGLVDPESLARALRPTSILVSVMLANNETGAIQPVAALAALARANGALFHTDAAQAVGKIKVDVRALGVDLLTVAGHKLYAPKGVGALYVREGVRLARLIDGADHERGLRAGTENVAGVVGLGAACTMAASDLEAEGARQRALSERFVAGVVSRLPAGAVRRNGHPLRRLPNTVNLGFRRLAAADLLAAMPSLAASAGAACHTGETNASGVLGAMGAPAEYAAGALRFSLGRMTSEADVDRAIVLVAAAARKLLGLPPVANAAPAPTPPRLVLASTSRYRKELLTRLGLPFSAAAPKYDEPPLPLPPDQLVVAHATAKAESLAADFPDALIVGSDQLVSFEGEVLGKPGGEAAAVAQLLRLAGRTHRLLTAVVVHEPRTGRTETALVIHEMTLRPLAEREAINYVRRDKPIDCAGAYKLEALGVALMESVRGEDDTAIQGLPLVKLCELLRRFGLEPLGD